MSTPEANNPVTTGLRVSRPLSVEEHIDHLTIEGQRFGAAVARTPFDARVPGCPEWSVEDLVRHLGDVHRWAGTIVRDRVRERLRRDFEGPSDRDHLLAWYGEGHRQLLAALSAASPDDDFWAWAPAPNPLAFWARRQAHETAIHRLDAEQAGGSPTPFDAVAAADGVDEWLAIAWMRAKIAGGRGRRVHFAALDVPCEWSVELRDDGMTVQRGATDGDCSVHAPAGDLFALVLNRIDATGLDVTGDVDVLRVWRESVRF